MGYTNSGGSAGRACVGCQGVSAASAWVSVGARANAVGWRHGAEDALCGVCGSTRWSPTTTQWQSSTTTQWPTRNRRTTMRSKPRTARRRSTSPSCLSASTALQIRRRAAWCKPHSRLLGSRRKRNEGADCGRRAKRPRVVVVGDNHIRRTASCAVCS
jgi:hypothetical protein